MRRKQRIPDIHFYEWSVIRWLGSDTRALLDPAGRGIFRELLDLCYTQGSIPRDFELMARKADCTVEQINRVWPSISKHFQADKKDKTVFRNRFADTYRRNYFAFILQKKRARAGESRDSEPPKPNTDSGMSVVRPDQYDTRQDNTIRDDTTPYDKRACVVAKDFPLMAAAIREDFPATDDAMVAVIAMKAMQAYADAVTGKQAPDLTDEILAQAIPQARFKTQESAAAYQTTIPRVVKTWVAKAISAGRIH